MERVEGAVAFIAKCAAEAGMKVAIGDVRAHTFVQLFFARIVCK
jgi:hypothetical protein